MVGERCVRKIQFHPQSSENNEHDHNSSKNSQFPKRTELNSLLLSIRPSISNLSHKSYRLQTKEFIPLLKNHLHLWTILTPYPNLPNFSLIPPKLKGNFHHVFSLYSDLFRALLHSIKSNFYSCNSQIQLPMILYQSI